MNSEIRQILIKKNVLRILIGFLQNDPSSNWEMLEDFQWKENTQPEIGNQIKVEEKLQIEFAFEDITYQRKYTLVPTQIYLFEAISTLLRSVSFHEESNYSFINNVNLADKYVMNYMRMPENISQLILKCDENLSIISLTKALISISWENFSYKEAIIEGLYMSLEKIHWYNVKKYFYFVKNFINCKDSLQQHFVSAFNLKLLEIGRASCRERVSSPV